MPTYARFIIIFTLSILINTQTIQPTQAADEFGERFWNQTAAGFGEPTAQPQNELLATDMDAIAAALQNIQPAAGDSEIEAPENAQSASDEQTAP